MVCNHRWTFGAPETVLDEGEDAQVGPRLFVLSAAEHPMAKLERLPGFQADAI
jgi:hypothetical protein